jgi:hypothetical protein
MIAAFHCMPKLLQPFNKTSRSDLKSAAALELIAEACERSTEYRPGKYIRSTEKLGVVAK